MQGWDAKMRNADKLISAREAALKALGIYRRNNAWSDLTLNGLIRGSDLPPAEAALMTKIVYGVLQNLTLCDYVAAQFSSIELKKLEPRVLDILRMSIYQLVFLTRVPASAAVNEGVALARKYSNQRAAGFVNAVLRKIAKAVEDGALPELPGDGLQGLSVKYSHPEWLVKEFCGVLGPDGAEALMTAGNDGDTPITVQVNTLISDTEEALTALAADGVDAVRHEWLDSCLELRGAGNITRLEAFSKGLIYVQDAAAKLSVIAAGPKKNNFVVDGCAAPGGKSFAAAIQMENKGRIAAFDVHAAKLRNMENSAGRLKIDIIETFKRDSSLPPDTLSGSADVVLADVPCSGFGVIRKKPEIRYKDEREAAGLPDIQKKILQALSAYTKPGGTLLYSTCTILKRENEEVIEWFLRNNGLFSLEAFTLPGVGEVPDGMITLWPHIHATDGFFICKMRRKV